MANKIILACLLLIYGGSTQAQNQFNSLRLNPGATTISGNGWMRYLLSTHKAQVIINGTTENIATEAWVTANAGGTVTGTGSANRIPYWTGTSTLSFGPYWDNTNTRIGIGEVSPQSGIHLTSAAPRILMFDNDNVISGSNPAWSVRSQNSPASFVVQSTADYSSYTDRFSINSSGRIFFHASLTNDNTETDILVRQSDGEIQTRAASTLIGIGGSTGAFDNRILRADGTGGSTVQASAITIDDSGNLSTVNTLTTNNLVISQGAVTSGTYVPTITHHANITSHTLLEFGYIRVGDQVYVHGVLQVTPTVVATSTLIRISLPIASIIGGDTIAGSGNSFTGIAPNLSAAVDSWSATNEAILRYTSTGTTVNQFEIHFGYRIIP